MTGVQTCALPISQARVTLSAGHLQLNARSCGAEGGKSGAQVRGTSASTGRRVGSTLQAPGPGAPTPAGGPSFRASGKAGPAGAGEGLPPWLPLTAPHAAAPGRACRPSAHPEHSSVCAAGKGARGQVSLRLPGETSHRHKAAGWGSCSDQFCGQHTPELLRSSI